MFKKIASNTIAMIFSKAGTAIISIFLISILTNYLTIELYGLYSKIYNYVGIFVFLADLGLYTITIREITSNKKDTDKIIGNVMTLRLILGILILFLATFIAYFIPGYNSDLALYSIIIISIFTIFQLLNSSILSLMQANMKVEFNLFSTIFAKLINLSFICFVVYVLFNKNILLSGDDAYFYPFLLIMTAGLLGIIINTILNYFYARRFGNIKFRFDIDYIKYIFKIALPYGIALFLSVVYFKLDIIILSIIEGPVAGDLSIALYSLPMKIVEVLMIVGGFYLNSLLPSLTKAYENKNKKEVNQLISISFKIMFSFASFVFVMGVLFRDYIIEIIANKNYLITTHIYNSSDAFLVVFAVIVFSFISMIFIYSLIASNNQSKLLKINIIVTIINIIGNILLIPYFSFIGAGITTLISQILLTFMGYYYTKNIIDFKLPYLFIFKNIILGIVIYSIGYFILNNYPVGLYFDFFVYGGVLFSFYLSIFIYNYIFLKKGK